MSPRTVRIIFLPYVGKYRSGSLIFDKLTKEILAHLTEGRWRRTRHLGILDIGRNRLDYWLDQSVRSTNKRTTLIADTTVGGGDSYVLLDLSLPHCHDDMP